MSDVRILVLAVIEIHASSIGKRFPKDLIVQVQSDGSPLELLRCHVTSYSFRLMTDNVLYTA
jgi:hypothetical protein